jgi:hypothetical protein
VLIASYSGSAPSRTLRDKPFHRDFSHKFGLHYSLRSPIRMSGCTRCCGGIAQVSISPHLDAIQTHFACAQDRRNRKLPCSRISVIPAMPPIPLHTLLLHGLLPLEQEAPVDIAVQDRPPGCRRQALGSGLIGAIAGIAELPTAEAPWVII